MANIMELPDGKQQTVFDLHDFMELVDSYMGMEARTWLSEYLFDLEDEYSDYASLEADMEDKNKHHKEVMEELHGYTAKLADLISKKDLDRRAISNTVGSLSSLIWKEMNRC